MTQLKTLDELRSSLEKLRTLEEQLATARQYLRLTSNDLIFITCPYGDECDALNLPQYLVRPVIVSIEQSLLTAIKGHCDFLGVSWGKS